VFNGGTSFDLINKSSSEHFIKYMKGKLYKNYLALWSPINKIATCCSDQHDCYYVNIMLKHNRLSNLKIINFSFINCGWYCDLWGSLWCNEKLRKFVVFGKAWIKAPNSNHFTWGHETPFLPNGLLTGNGFTAGILRTAYHYRRQLVPRYFHFLRPLKK